MLYAVVERSNQDIDALVDALSTAADEIAARWRRAEAMASGARAQTA